MAPRFVKIISSFLILGGTLTACSSATDASLSEADAQRLATAPKVPGYVLPPSFKSEFTVNEFRVFIFGEITKVLSPVSSCMADGEACFEYVPVEVRLIGSKPEISESSVILRSFPTAEFAEDPRILKVGDIILANPAPRTLDTSDVEAYSLGTMFRVDDSGGLRLYQANASSLGTLAEVDQEIGTNFAGLFTSSR
jgi:hypothetical protein